MSTGKPRELDAVAFAASGDLDSLKKLIDSGIDVNVAGTSRPVTCSLVLLCSHLLSVHEDYDKRSCLHLAAAEGRLPVVKFLLEKKAKVNVVDRFGNTPLEDALKGHHRDVVKYDTHARPITSSILPALFIV